MGEDVLSERTDIEATDTDVHALETSTKSATNGVEEATTSNAPFNAVTEMQPELTDASSQVSKLLQYSRTELLALRSKQELRSPPQDWDVQQFSELYKPFVKEGQGPPPGFGPVANGSENSGQLRKDSWRGKQPNVRGGPIRSRLVHEGSLNDADAKQAGSPQQDNAEQQAAATGSAQSSARPARTGGRRDNDAQDWWGNGDSWRGPGAGPGRGRGPGPTAPPGPGERQWMGRGGAAAAGPVEIPAGAPGKTPEREAATPRSLEADWRSSKKVGPVPSPSSWEWGSNHRQQGSDRDLKRPPGFPDPHERHRSSSRNPEWMADSSSAGKDDADGLTAGARRAKDFEAERQRMKEEWKREQAKGGAAKVASGTEYMTNEDLEGLSADSQDAEVAAARSKSNASEQPQPPPGLPIPPAQRSASVSNLPDTSSQEMQRISDGSATGTASAAQAFSFNSLAQAAGLTLRPMPRGVTNLEEIEKLQSGNLENNHHINVSLAHIDPHTGNLAAHPQPAVAETPQAAAPEVSTTPAMQSPFAAHAGDQTQQQADTGRTLFDTLSGGGATAGMPPPGFAVSKAPSAISWGSCNHLQGIWGAPTSTPGFTGQPDWGPPASANLASFPSQNPLSPSAAASANVQPAANQLLQLRQQHVQQQAAAPQLDQRLLFPPRETPPPIAHNPAAPFTSQLDQLSRAQQAQQALAALTNRDPGAAQLPHQDGNVNRAVDAAQNPLLALLGRHNASATTGHRGNQDAQLQAFLQAQTSHYSWQPPTPSPAHQVRPAMMQQRANYLPQQTAPAANAALSQDLLRQLQLGQNIRNNAAAAFTPPPQPGLHAYQQPAAHLQQPARLPPQYGGQGPYAQLQASPQYPQQHQLPFNLGSGLPHQSYPAQYQALQNLGLPAHALPSLGNPASHTSLGNSAFSEHHQRSIGSQQTLPQTCGSQDLATQLHLQRLQSRQRAYAQAQQQSIDINKLFAPRPFGHAPATTMSAVPNMQLSLQELEAMMARQ